MKKRIWALLLMAFPFSLCAQPCQSPTRLSAEILLLKLREGSADNWGQIITSPGEYQTANLLDVPFQWDLGVRLGLGRYWSQNDWDTMLYYTYFKTTENVNANTNSGGIYSSFLGNFYVNNLDGTGFGPNYYNAGMNWEVEFNVLDVQWGKTFDQPSYQMRPFVGVKLAKIDQSIDSTWASPTVATNFQLAHEQAKNNFYGIGPLVGVDSSLPLGSVFCRPIQLLGQISGALLWGHWSFDDYYSNDALTTVQVNVSPVDSAASTVRGFLGVEYQNDFSEFSMLIRLGYEAQVWFSQLQYYSLNVGRLNNVMSLQGGLLEFHFNF